VDGGNILRGVEGAVCSLDGSIALVGGRVVAVESPRGVVYADDRVVESRSPVRLMAAVVPGEVWVRENSRGGMSGTGSTAAPLPDFAAASGLGSTVAPGPVAFAV
jgi:hypothetical protein